MLTLEAAMGRKLKLLAAAVLILAGGASAPGISSATSAPRMLAVHSRASLGGGYRYRVTSILANRSGKRVRGQVKLTLSRSRRPGKVALGSRRAYTRRYGKVSIVSKATVWQGVPAGRYFLVSCFRFPGGSSCAARRVKVKRYVNGARSGGDSLFPEVGNGGYDALHYAINLDYDPLSNEFNPGTRTTVTARATQNLRQFSLDFEGLTVTRVSVNGVTSGFLRKDTKLIVAPHKPIDRGRKFTVTVDYFGYINHHVDPDDSLEGWVRACRSGDPGPDNPDCFGSFTVSEPIGAQTWFPDNNIPSDKATFTTATTVPTESDSEEWTALGTGEFISKTTSGGKTTWRWRETLPTSTYLTTGSVCRCVYAVGSATDNSDGRTFPLYNAYDNSATPAQAEQIGEQLDLQGSIINEFSALFGPYPLNSGGVFAASTTDVGYVLENQGKIHFPDPGIDNATLAHEYVHQWFGDAVGPATWNQIWFNEGWAQWGEWYHDSPATPADAFTAEYASTDDPERWNIPPGTLNNDPSLLFDDFSTYIRPAMMLEGYREIFGHARFTDLAKALQTDFAHSTIDADQFIETAVDVAGVGTVQEAALRDYFQQWLFGVGKPTLVPDNFPPESQTPES